MELTPGKARQPGRGLTILVCSLILCSARMRTCHDNDSFANATIRTAHCIVLQQRSAIEGLKPDLQTP